MDHVVQVFQCESLVLKTSPPLIYNSTRRSTCKRRDHHMGCIFAWACKNQTLRAQQNMCTPIGDQPSERSRHLTVVGTCAPSGSAGASGSIMSAADSSTRLTAWLTACVRGRAADCWPSASMRDATRRRRAEAKRREMVPSTGSLRLKRELASESCSMIRSATGDDTGNCVRRVSAAEAVGCAGLPARSSTCGASCNHSASKLSSAALSSAVAGASVGSMSASSSSQRVGASSGLTMPATGGATERAGRVTASASCLGARSMFERPSATGERAACEICSRTRASANFAASSSSNSCT
mmetsp:Transcript_56901/g.130681  ORF Transcript_56901/g.130681 Transcript_56901/m.130681 type:complete len:297 (+) Transcript_56901:134-1024(+)